MSLLQTLEEGTKAVEQVPIIGQGVEAVDRAGVFYSKLIYKAPYPKKSTLEREQEAVERAAAKWHINSMLLWGVYGAETAHGADVKPSSTGAQGPFQFEPETARRYGYPLNVNTNGVTNFVAFGRQADAAAHYLHDLLPGKRGEDLLKRGKGGNWEAAWEEALRAYSGGGYGLAHVKAEGSKAAEVPAGETANLNTYIQTEEEPITKNFWAKLLAAGVKLVLLLVGAVLVIYGIMVAVRPPEQALAFPKP